MLPFLDSVVNFFNGTGSKLIDMIPTEAKKAEARLLLTKELDSHIEKLTEMITSIDKTQLEINKVEAQSSSVFVAGWRPYIGWCCGAAITWMFLLQPMIQTVLFWSGKASEAGRLDTASILGLTSSLLGFGGMRMFESLKGVERSNLKEF